MGDGKDSSKKLTDCCMCGISTPSLAGSRRRYCSKGSGMRLGLALDEQLDRKCTYSILKCFQVDSTGMWRMTLAAR